MAQPKIKRLPDGTYAISGLGGTYDKATAIRVATQTDEATYVPPIAGPTFTTGAFVYTAAALAAETTTPAGVVKVSNGAQAFADLSDTQFIERSGTDIIGAAAAGTSTSIRETGGPTDLAVGAIPTTTLFQRVGSTVVGLPLTSVNGAFTAVATTNAQKNLTIPVAGAETNGLTEAFFYLKNNPGTAQDMGFMFNDDHAQANVKMQMLKGAAAAASATASGIVAQFTANAASAAMIHAWVFTKLSGGARRRYALVEVTEFDGAGNVAIVRRGAVVWSDVATAMVSFGVFTDTVTGFTADSWAMYRDLASG